MGQRTDARPPLAKIGLTSSTEVYFPPSIEDLGQQGHLAMPQNAL